MASASSNGELPLRPRHVARPSPDAIKHDLETRFLAPPTTFSAEWLNRLQQRWDDQVDYVDLCQIAPTQSRTVTRFTREGLEGRVTGYKEVTVPASSATAKNSTSMLRRPAQRADFVRGAAGYFPFAPGGIDGVDAIQAFEDAEQAKEEEGKAKKPSGLNRIINLGDGGGLLQIPPGFTRGLNLEKKDNDAEEVEKTLEEDDAVVDNNANGYLNGASTSHPSTPLDDEDDFEDDFDLAKLLPVEFPSLAPHGQLKASSAHDRGREWAHVVDVNKDIPNFGELVPDMARTWPFELDVFQKEAVYHLENGDSVFVAAHTSAGKTVVAEYAIALSAKHMTKTIYTSPIKALSNQKFRDFKNEFDDVGILTGDVQINPEASCLIMTTEILRSMLYRGADLIRDVEFVIFDEVHYLNDAERGVVWEEVIIMLPDHVNLILLSATIPNTYEFASWVGRTKKKNIYVISTSKRPVPLEHYLWADKNMHKIVNAERRFLENGWKSANDILTGADKIKEQKAIQAQAPARGAVNGRGARGGPQQRGGGGQRGGPQQRGRGGQNPNRGHGNIARTGRGGGRTTAAQDRTIWIGVVDHLKKENLLPACIFVFSKKRCEENADSLGKKDFSTAAEKSAIHMTIEKSIARLKPEDRTLPQIGRLRDMLERGIAVHHGGLLPIVKEIVEILFARTLVKVLFATETFAMGLNLPTRTVVFSGYRKHDGREFRNLLPGEYTQMAGRAGRRGLDTVGTVIIVASGRTEAPPAAELRAMILGQPTKLRSQFRLHYNMILNLMRVEALKIEEMIKRSFSENATQALLPQHEKQISLSEANLDKIKREPCAICDVDLSTCHAAAEEFNRLTKQLHEKILASPVGRRLLNSLRLIVFQKGQIRIPGILLEDGLVKGSQTTTPRVRVLAIQNVDAERTPTILLPFLPAFRPQFAPLPSDPFKLKASPMLIPLEDVELVTHTRVKAETVRTILNPESAEQDRFIENEFLKDYKDWAGKAYNEQEWTRVTELSVRELLAARAKAAEIAQNAKCLDCPDFLKHYTLEHDADLIRTTIESLRTQMSDQNLSLLPDYHQRVAVLADLHFISSPNSSTSPSSHTALATTSRVELKGKVACEIHSADELVLTELILENVLAEYMPQEIVALLSAFVFQEKTDIEPRLNDRLQAGVERIIAISERVNERQIYHQVILGGDEGAFSNPSNVASSGGGGGGDGGQGRDSGGGQISPRFGLVEVVYNWADGLSFREIMGLTDVMEGTIVRVVTRLDETCREVMSAARLVGDPGLYGKMEKAREMIRRDVVFTASLYM